MSEVYNSSIDYLIDELRLLDVRLGTAISQLKDSGERQDWNEYSGLYVTKKEVEFALRKDVTKSNLSLDRSSLNELANKESLLEQTVDRKKKERGLKDYGYVIRLHHISNVLSLSAFERNVIIICLAPEIDSKYERIYAYLQNDVTKKKPSMGLILDLLCSTINEKIEFRKFFSYPSAPL